MLSTWLAFVFLWVLQLGGLASDTFPYTLSTDQC